MPTFIYYPLVPPLLSVEHVLTLGLIILTSLCNRRDDKKGEVCIRAKVAHQVRAYPGFCSMRRLGVFLLLPGWDASPHRVTPNIKLAISFKTEYCPSVPNLQNTVK